MACPYIGLMFLLQMTCLMANSSTKKILQKSGREMKDYLFEAPCALAYVQTIKLTATAQRQGVGAGCPLPDVELEVHIPCYTNHL